MPALLALFIRALRQELRSRSTYWTRSGFVALVALFAGFTALGPAWQGAPGLAVFKQLIWTNMVFIVVGSLGYFASVVAEEKEENTLGLLRMTNLNALSILLGKSTSRLLGALLMLAVQFPFTMLAVTLGGVSLRQIAAAYVALGAYLFLVANLALLASVVCRRVALAAVLTGIGQAVLIFGPMVLAWMFRVSLRLAPLDYPAWSPVGALHFWWSSMPAAQMNRVLATGFSDPVFTWQTAANLGLGVVLFLVAWAVFEPCCRYASEGEGPAMGPVRAGSPASRRRTWSMALAWKDWRFNTGGRVAFGIKAVLLGGAAGWALIAIGPPIRRNPAEHGYALFWIGAVFWCGDCVRLAGRVFRTERRDRTLATLGMLPRSMRSIAHQKIAGVALTTWPGLVVALAGLALVMPDIAGDLFRREDAAWIMAVVVLCCAAAFAFMIHLVAFLSLVVKYGAIPLAIVGSFVAVQVFSMMTAMMMGLLMPLSGSANTNFGIGGMVVVFLATCLVLSALLHWATGRRLEHLAGAGE